MRFNIAGKRGSYACASELEVYIEELISIQFCRQLNAKRCCYTTLLLATSDNTTPHDCLL